MYRGRCIGSDPVPIVGKYVNVKSTPLNLFYQIAGVTSAYEVTIRTALAQTKGNVSHAAGLLQLGRTTVIQKMAKYEITAEELA